MHSAATPHENRRFPRMAIDCPIEYRLADGGELHIGQAKNISGNGMLFFANDMAPPDIGSLMEIQVRPGHPSIPALDAVVEIIRVTDNACDKQGKTRRCGCEIGAVILSMK